MSFCDIVVDACPRGDIDRTLGYARELAAEFRAKLLVASYAWPRLSIADALPPNIFSVQEQTRSMEDALTATRKSFDKVFGNSNEVAWHSGLMEPIAALRDHLMAADLLITSSSEGDTCVSPDSAELALRSGAPVLRLGQAAVSCRFPKVLVGWKDCAQARRAMHGALPLLKRAESIEVVGVGNEVSIDRLEAVATHLRRHQVKARPCHIPRSEDDVCADLVNHAMNEGATLIIAGVYSRGSLTERVLGGVTRDMLKSTDISWFLAH